jgi:lipopolysaccharide biosynthesis glycosyltransferase
MKNQIYIGYDPREHLAYEVCRKSIERRTKISDFFIQKLTLQLANYVALDRVIEMKDGKMWCPISQAYMSTEFAISRFCIPFFHDKGWHLFMDCDMLVQDDIKSLFALADSRYAVMVVKHKQESGPEIKMDGQVQSYYSRKNWSSVILWNCDHPSHKKLTKEMLNTSPGRELHAFKWLEDNEIGELPIEWNHLVGVYEPNPNAKILHYTLGGPWIKDWGIRQVEDPLWIEEFQK